jgi:hypothetical protein
MDTTIRNIDEQSYREAHARAVLEGRTVGDVVNEALRSYLKRSPERQAEPRGRLRPERFRDGNEGLSGEIDELYTEAGRDRSRFELPDRFS